MAGLSATATTPPETPLCNESDSVESLATPMGGAVAEHARAVAASADVSDLAPEEAARHVTIWNRHECRKIAGNAAPLRRNLGRYLHKHPECEEYDGQDKRLDGGSMDGAVDPITGQLIAAQNEHVPIWHKHERRKVTGNAAPLKKNLHVYLAKHPECEEYNGQDKMLDEMSAATASAFANAAADGQKFNAPALGSGPSLLQTSAGLAAGPAMPWQQQQRQQQQQQQQQPAQYVPRQPGRPGRPSNASRLLAQQQQQQAAAAAAAASAGLSLPATINMVPARTAGLPTFSSHPGRSNGGMQIPTHIRGQSVYATGPGATFVDVRSTSIGSNVTASPALSHTSLSSMHGPGIVSSTMGMTTSELPAAHRGLNHTLFTTAMPTALGVGNEPHGPSHSGQRPENGLGRSEYDQPPVGGGEPTQHQPRQRELHHDQEQPREPESNETRDIPQSAPVNAYHAREVTYYDMASSWSNMPPWLAQREPSIGLPIPIQSKPPASSRVGILSVGSVERDRSDALMTMGSLGTSLGACGIGTTPASEIGSFFGNGATPMAQSPNPMEFSPSNFLQTNMGSPHGRNLHMPR
jgi:BRK domain